MVSHSCRNFGLNFKCGCHRTCFCVIVFRCGRSFFVSWRRQACFAETAKKSRQERRTAEAKRVRRKKSALKRAERTLDTARERSASSEPHVPTENDSAESDHYDVAALTELDIIDDPRRLSQEAPGDSTRSDVADHQEVEAANRDLGGAGSNI